MNKFDIDMTIKLVHKVPSFVNAQMQLKTMNDEFVHFQRKTVPRSSYMFHSTFNHKATTSENCVLIKVTRYV